MTLVGVLVLAVVFVLAWRGRGRPERPAFVSERWRREHLYTHGKS